MTAALTTSQQSDLTEQSRRRTSYAYYVAFVGLGMVTGVLGPSLDVFKERTHSNDSKIAVLFALLAIGYALNSPIAGRLIDRRPGNPIMAVGLIISALMISGLTGSSSLLLIGAMVVMLGAATSYVDTGGNTLITWLHGENLGPWMVALHAAFGVGAALAPLVLAASTSLTDGINPGLFGIAGVSAVSSVLLFRRRSPAHVAEERDTHDGSKPAPRRIALLVTAAFFFLYVGLEVGFAGWIYTFATDHGFTATRAKILNSAFWWAFTAGRLIGIPLARVFDAKRQIYFDAAVTALAAVVLVIGRDSSTLVWVASMGLGLGLATMFPAMINLANERVAVTGTVTSWFIGGAGAGSAVLPWLVGRFFGWRGSGVLPWFVLVLTGLVVVVSASAARLLEKQ